jgi:hypothetical protein
MIRKLWKRCRSALSGRFVTKAEAKADPGGTVCETVKRDEGDM